MVNGRHVDTPSGRGRVGVYKPRMYFIEKFGR